MRISRRSLLGHGIAFGATSVLGLSHLRSARATTPSLRNLADFESGTLGILKAAGSAPAATDAVSRAGRWAMRSFLDRGKSNSYRAEAQVPGQQDIWGEYWIGISMMPSSDWVPSNSREQWFNTHSMELDWSRGTNGITALTIGSARESDVSMRGAWMFENNTLHTKNGPKSDQRLVVRENCGPVVPGEWVDWVFNWRWDWRTLSEGGVGFTRVWKNGKQVVDYKGPNCYNDTDASGNPQGPYVKFGVYKWDWADGGFVDTVSTRTVYHDEYREAGSDGSLALVSPGGAAAPKPPISLTVD